MNDTLEKSFPSINSEQQKIINHTIGPALIIAGPGSGKTFSLILRTMNLLLENQAKPSEILLCTFTEKAAGEMKDRLSLIKRKIGFKTDTSELQISTIHSLCNSILMEFRHKTSLGNNYETLDELTQLLFINDHFKEIFSEDLNPPFCGKWKTKWAAIQGSSKYFNKITEELIDCERLKVSEDDFIKKIGIAYLKYEELLFQNNKIDFSCLQKTALNLLNDSSISERISSKIKFVMVDEYQDTNYVQEQIILKLIAKHKNICVVGDEDQSLYRFRGATVRNILEFPNHFPDLKRYFLTTNYRSHKDIVSAYDSWMKTAKWSDKKGNKFRFDKEIVPDPNTEHKKYPAVFSIWGRSKKDEAERFANLVHFLKTENIIKDFNQVALLLHSVKYEHSGEYIEALERKNIPAFCPRARTYFENDEIRLLVGCYAVLLGYFDAGKGNLFGWNVKEFIEYTDQCIVFLGSKASAQKLFDFLRNASSEISALKEKQSLDKRLSDYQYEFLEMEPFYTMIRDENKARNLSLFSKLLNVFQNYYHYTVITNGNRDYLRLNFFNSFLKLLYEGGINEYEDPYQPFPSGHVQILTIHQSKGLEFPVVAVGSLNKTISSSKQIDEDLEEYYFKKRFEPEKMITEFDRMRLFYVAFSRAEKLLALTSDSESNPYLKPIWEGLAQWPYVEKELIAAQSWEIKQKDKPRKSYSFTSDILIYETCPRQYLYYKDYGFTHSRSAVLFFGLLVHQSIEEIHRMVLDRNIHLINEEKVKELFDKTFQFLAMSSDAIPPGEAQKKSALAQVLNYYHLNKNELNRVIDTEVDVSVEKEGYILNGKVDLLLGEDGKLELLDFKTSQKSDDPRLIAKYEDQLSVYAHILETRYGKKPERLLLYWTSEKTKEAALQEFDYKPEKVKQAAERFDKVVSDIQEKKYEVIKPPEKKICKECDFRFVCRKEGIIGKI